MNRIPVEVLLDTMKQHGSSVILNWGEDNELWECSWITDGKRFTAYSKELRESIRLTIIKVRGQYPQFGLVLDKLFVEYAHSEPQNRNLL